MQQRRLRLGDILDDYCPRERRITNHAVVAMIDDEVKQTRCTTCDADHEYKQARIPPQRRKKANAGGEAEGAGRLRPVEEESIVSEDIAVAASEPEETFDPAPLPLPVEEEPAETQHCRSHRRRGSGSPPPHSRHAAASRRSGAGTERPGVHHPAARHAWSGWQAGVGIARSMRAAGRFTIAFRWATTWLWPGAASCGRFGTR